MENYDAIIRARAAIKKKYNALRRGESEAIENLEKHFKPITVPLKEILLGSKKSDDGSNAIAQAFHKAEVKEEISSEHGGDDEFNEPYGKDDQEEVGDVSVDTYVNENFGPMVAPYIREMLVRGQDFDHTYGIRQGDGEQWTIGNKVVTFGEDDVIEVDGEPFAPTPGLLELIFLKNPQSYTKADSENYKRILELTNAHRRGNRIGNPLLNNRTDKFKRIVKPLVVRGKEQQTHSSSLREHRSKAKSNSPPKKRKKDWRRSLKVTSTGSGVFVPSKRRTYVYWDDPNELVERLNLLIASKRSGHTGHDREILSIEEELREAGYVL